LQWSLHRTAVVRARDQGAGAPLAAAYADFYSAGWDGFRSRFQDGAAAARAVCSAAAFFRDGRALLARLRSSP
jgi:hypothetical protein